ncbi:MAG: leucine-rich repeat protein [Roseburia sp.]|nr:leucine-rich repeat protein [Roseburia sp.]
MVTMNTFGGEKQMRCKKIILGMITFLAAIVFVIPSVYADNSTVLAVGDNTPMDSWSWKSSENTLMLNNFTSSTTYTRGDKTCLIYANDDLIIDLSGRNVLDTVADYAIYVAGTLTLTGDGTLELSNSATGIYARDIVIDGDVTITGSSPISFVDTCIMNDGAIRMSVGISGEMYGALTLNNGEIHIVSAYGPAINLLGGCINIENGTLYGEGTSGTSDGIELTMNGGNVTLIGTEDIGLGDAIVITDGVLNVIGYTDGVSQTSMTHKIQGGTVNIKAKNNGICGSWGEICVSGGALNIDCGGYGVQYTYGSNDVKFQGGDVSIKSGYGAIDTSFINLGLDNVCAYAGDTEDNLVETTKYRQEYILKTHGHTFVNPVFNWSADGKNCKVTFVCSKDETHVVTYDCKVVSTVKKVSTCKDMGETTYTATYTVGDKVYIDQKDVIDIPKKEHSWDAGRITKEATATEEGEKTYTCSVCRTIKIEKIPALGVPEEGVLIKDENNTASYKVTRGGTEGGTVQYVTPADRTKKKIVIPDTITVNGITYKITSISEKAFMGNKNITSVAVGNNITGIPNNAFKNCTKLTTVKMGTGVKNIGANGFYGCKKLKSVTIGSNVTTIGDKAFYKCESLTGISIPSKVKKIGKSAFLDCKKLKTITIRTKKLTNKNVGNNAFKGMGSSYYNKVVVKVPSKSYVEKYKTLFQKKGLSSKAKVKKL